MEIGKCVSGCVMSKGRWLPSPLGSVNTNSALIVGNCDSICMAFNRTQRQLFSDSGATLTAHLPEFSALGVTAMCEDRCGDEKGKPYLFNFYVIIMMRRSPYYLLI